MPINRNEVVAGGFYRAGNGALRRIDEIIEGETSTKIIYSRKSINPNPNHKYAEFDYGHSKTIPPSVESFCDSCDSKLTDDEIDRLLKNDILRKHEIL